LCGSSARDGADAKVFSCTKVHLTGAPTAAVASASDVAAVQVLSSVAVDGMFLESTRLHVLDLLEEGYSADDVADIIGCSTRSMRRWVHHMAANGTVWRNPDLRNLHADAAVRNVDLTRAILTLVEAEPAAFLSSHVDLLVALSLDYPTSDHRYVSASTVYRILRRHDYTRKKIERLYAERSLAAQRAFAVAFNEIPPRCVVSVDETHTAGSDLYLKYGRTRRNVRCVLYDRDARTVPRTSTMMAVSLTHGVLWSQTVIVVTAQTADDWRLFLQCLRSQMNTYIPGLPWDMQPDACVVLYDNAGIHDEAGDEYMQANGMHHVRLPPYSPNLQPIEGVFSDLKKHVRSLVYEDGRYLDKPMRLMAAAVSMLTTAQVAGQFSRVYNNLAELLADGPH